jgi:iron complex outermembrane receptor protein
MKTPQLWLTTSVLALAWCGVANAQTAQTASPAGPSAAAPTQEVVVTAERRSVNLQRSALSATVLTGADLVKKGVATVDQLQFVTPNLTVQNFGQGNLFNIRGIGKADGSSSVSVGVITYRDGVASFPGYFQSEPYYDIANVQVLRGPQGTFAGQNATGGAVFINEVDPSFGGYHGYIQGQYGDYNDAGLQGAVNIPVSDTLALRVAANSEYRDSFYTITGPHTGDPGRLQSNSARFSLLWTPTEALKVLFKADYNDINEGGYAADPPTATNDLFHITNNAHNSARDVFGRLVLNISYVLPDGITLKSVSGYQKGTTTLATDYDGTSAANLTLADRGDEQIYSQEFNIISPNAGPLTWVLGGYFQRDMTVFPTGTFDIGAPFPFGGVTLRENEFISGANPKTTAAGFGQISYNITPALQIQVGARYTSSTSSNHGVSSLIIAPIAAEFLAQNASESDSKLTGKVALNYTLDPNNFLYVFVATGHKAGGINGVNLVGVPARTFAPEDVTDYEAGWKATNFGGHLRTQIDAFYSDYKDFQVTIADPTVTGLTALYNAPSTTKIYGLEASGQAVFGALSFDFGASYLHSSLGKFFAEDPRFPATGSCNASTGPAAGTCMNLEGNDTPNAPHFTANMGAQYAFPLNNGDTLTPRVAYSHTDGSWATLFENASLGDRLSTRDIVNLQLTYQHQDWLLTAYATNLNDDHYVAAVSSNLRFAGPPRQYGVRLRKDF